MLKLEAISSRQNISADNHQQLIYFLLSIAPPPDYIAPRLPLNICLVIDRSTSMKGARLERVKAAVKLLINSLSAQDNISIITFSDRAEIVVPSVKIIQRVQLISQLQNIRASGGTEMYQGLIAGFRELNKNHGSGTLSHLVLLTDGHTYGDAHECLKVTAEAATHGIGITAFGIGAEWNDRFLDELVAPSGGQSDFIASPEQIIDFLQKRIKGWGNLYARNLRLISKLPLGVRIHELFRIAPLAQPLSKTKVEVKIGNIEGTEPISLLMEVALDSQLVGQHLELSFSIVADIPAYAINDYKIAYKHEIEVLSEVESTEPPEAIVEAVRVLQMYRMHEQVWDDLDGGKVQQATQRMNRLTSRLAEAGYDQLAAHAQVETRRLMKMGSMSPEGRKKLKYGTRSLMTQSLAITPTTPDADKN